MKPIKEVSFRLFTGASLAAAVTIFAALGLQPLQTTTTLSLPPPSMQPATYTSPWISLGGATLSHPSVVSWGAGREDVFVRGTNNNLYHKWYADDHWSSNWENLGGTLTSAPEAASYGPNELDVFARGADGFLYHKWYPQSPTQAGWSGWQKFGGPGNQPIQGGAGVTVSGYAPFGYLTTPREVVFVRGYDNHLWFSFQAGDWQGFSNWQSVGGSLGGDPDATIWPVQYAYGDPIDVFVRGSNSAMYRMSLSWNSSGGLQVNTGFQSLGGTCTSGPGSNATIFQEIIWESVFVRGGDGHLYGRFYSYPAWTGWRSFGGGVSGDPDVAYGGGIISMGNGRPGWDVFVRGNSGQVYYLNYYPM
jgi:hypothetical protein